MGFKDAVRTVLREKYATFQGRAARSEYWYFLLFYYVVAFILFLPALAFGLMEQAQAGEISMAAWIPIILVVLFALYCLIPHIAVSVRRLHDRNMSGWWLLGFIVLSAIPFVGFVASIAMLVIFCLKGTDGPNRFGNDPLRPDASADIFA